MKEEWKDIKGYEGLYQISSYGRVYSFYSNKVLNTVSNKSRKDGYIQVVLYKNDKRTTFLVHRLVAEAFIDNPNSYPQVNHKDEDKTNNCVSNLEWCTDKYNKNYGTVKERMIETQKRNGKNKGCNNPMYGKHHTEYSKNKISKILKEGNKFKGAKNPKAHKVQCITTGRRFNTIKEGAKYYNINRVSIIQCCSGKYKSAGKHPVTGERLVWKYLDDK